MKPDAWIIVKIKNKNETVHKIAAGWNGGYLHGNSWRVNSGIKSVDYKDGFYRFFGFSGSIYECHQSTYSRKICNMPALERIISACENQKAEYEILDENTDWMNYKFYEQD